MLYDILPPLLLLFSLGGIIVLIARAMVKMRAHEVSQEIAAHALSDAPVHAESLIGPTKGSVRIVKNRLFHAIAALKTGVMGIIPAIQASLAARKANIAAKKEENMQAPDSQHAKPTVKAGLKSVMKGIQLPEVSIREKFEAFTEKGKQGFSALRKEISTRTPNMKDGIQAMLKKEGKQATPTPVIRLVHQEPVREQKRGIVSQIMQRQKEETELEKAERVIGENDFDSAEDILVPYIMKHASDTKAYMLLGKAAIGKGAWDEAVEIFQQVLKMNNEEVDAHAQLGHAALHAGKFTMAMQALQRARDNDPEHIGIREDLLFIARRMDNKVVVKGVMEELEALKQKV
ncbi:MAG: hypothetical protein A3E36_04750 [Candidatus Andersenbacteria bacterium RIFCSPHIGHO2_12_FULL_45_11b]|uniref:Uncharacterized protein n=1 Tax=Candidatus Andersenbacteria bacterium RIFCSPHIGHO2_12_FULL_45_11b TaxID=1797282 RepID=A0A1G1XC45_9BACT|nr:MAG: hypothetical protein A3E36_04750 [Candidatus Andersenbacteria bacterium RIFCSPHIGHO2_12_FULL_45_11b]